MSLPTLLKQGAFCLANVARVLELALASRFQATTIKQTQAFSVPDQPTRNAAVMFCDFTVIWEPI